jgi:hypothetical protein
LKVDASTDRSPSRRPDSHDGDEDCILREQLEGDAAYAREVRYRLFPGIW